jgi:prevent-host-death family protein
MRTVGTVEAKLRWAELLTKASKGEPFLITRRGIPVARLVPAYESNTRSLIKVAAKIREKREGASLNGTKIRDLINEGRKF